MVSSKLYKNIEGKKIATGPEGELHFWLEFASMNLSLIVRETLWLHTNYPPMGSESVQP